MRKSDVDDMRRIFGTPPKPDPAKRARAIAHLQEIVDRGFPQAMLFDGREPITVLGFVGETGQRNEPYGPTTIGHALKVAGQMHAIYPDGRGVIVLAGNLTFPDETKRNSAAGRDMTFSEDCIGAHHGQLDLVLYARLDDKLVGSIEHVRFNDKIYISMIFVDPYYRRRGIATALWAELERLNPGRPIVIGNKTDDGMKFFRALKKKDG